jgi:nucleoside phosphorylase/xanthosine utilization system XapX-like protein
VVRNLAGKPKKFLIWQVAILTLAKQEKDSVQAKPVLTLLGVGIGMTIVEILEQFLKEKPRSVSWDDHRAWAGKVVEFLGEVYGESVREAFANIYDNDLNVMVGRQCGKLIGLIHKERSRSRQDSPQTHPKSRSLTPTPPANRKQTANIEPHSSLLKDGVDVAIVTALPMELQALLRHGGSWSMISPSEDSPRTFHICHTESGLSVLATCALGMGQLNAALATKDIIQKWRPKKVVLVGIAGGLRSDVQLGDVVVSEQIVDYELGKITTEGLEPRWSVYRSDPILLDRLRNFQSSEWVNGIAIPRPDERVGVRPRIIHDVVLSGNKVIADERAAGALASVWKRAAAIEMEGAGIAAALHQIKDAPPFIVIKGICDKADSKKGDEWQQYAAEAAAAFAMSFVQEMLQPSDTVNKLPQKEPEVEIPGIDSRALRLALSAAFSRPELKVMVSDLDVDWDEIPGGPKSERIVELIWYMKRRGRLPALVALVKKERAGLLESYAEGPGVENGA